MSARRQLALADALMLNDQRREGSSAAAEAAHLARMAGSQPAQALWSSPSAFLIPASMVWLRVRAPGARAAPKGKGTPRATAGSSARTADALQSMCRGSIAQARLADGLFSCMRAARRGGGVGATHGTVSHARRFPRHLQQSYGLSLIMYCFHPCLLASLPLHFLWFPPAAATEAAPPEAAPCYVDRT